MIAVVDCTSMSLVPDSIDVYPGTPVGRDAARRRFCELVAEDLQGAQSLSDIEALDRAAEYLHPARSIYKTGDSYIALVESGVTLHS